MRSRAIFLHATWHYNGHDLMQNEVADKLGIGRGTAIRLLGKARKSSKVLASDGEQQGVN
jgi:DNA-binding transcriptional regulator LsrR (DeoR family)